MLVKLQLLDTSSREHPMISNNVQIGYSKDVPELGHPILLWYSSGVDSTYLRTSRVNSLDEYVDSNTRKRYWLAETDHSTYRIETLDVQNQLEGAENV